MQIFRGNSDPVRQVPDCQGVTLHCADTRNTPRHAPESSSVTPRGTDRANHLRILVSAYLMPPSLSRLEQDCERGLRRAFQGCGVLLSALQHLYLDIVVFDAALRLRA